MPQVVATTSRGTGEKMMMLGNENHRVAMLGCVSGVHTLTMTIAATYAEFAAREAHGVSPIYERLSVAISGNEELLALLGSLPPAKQQPNLLFGVVRFLGGPVEDPRFP